MVGRGRRPDAGRRAVRRADRAGGGKLRPGVVARDIGQPRPIRRQLDVEPRSGKSCASPISMPSRSGEHRVAPRPRARTQRPASSHEPAAARPRAPTAARRRRARGDAGVASCTVAPGRPAARGSLDGDARVADRLQALLAVAHQAASSSCPARPAASAGSGLHRGRRSSTSASVSEIVSPAKAAAGQHLEQHDAERPDVGAPVGLLPARLLRAHVGGRAEDHAGLGCRMP